MNEDPITVVIVDDHALVREGLQSFLELFDEIQVVGEAENGEDAITIVRQEKPDIVLMDLVMSGMDGTEAIRKIKELGLSTKVIVLTSFSDDDRIFAAIKAGASGYLLKDITPRDLLVAIQNVKLGNAQLHPKVAKKLMGEFVERADDFDSRNLSKREMEVVKLLGRGLSNQQIALHLNLSEKTIKTYVSSVLSKLQLSDRTQVAIYAVRKGLID